MINETKLCGRCEGCGQLADSDDREPWSFWLNLPLQSAAAVVLGLVKPVPCDVCDGDGVVPVESDSPSGAVPGSWDPVVS